MRMVDSSYVKLSALIDFFSNLRFNTIQQEKQNRNFFTLDVFSYVCYVYI